MLRRAFINQNDAVATAFHISSHSGIPSVVIGAGGRVRPLGEDHHLLLERILVQPGRRLQKRCPVAYALRDLHGSIRSKGFKIRKFFVGHGTLLSIG